MSITLTKGQTINLKKNADNTENDLSKMTIGLGWDVNDRGADYDLDACALLLKNGKLSNESDVVSYRNKKHKSGTVWSTGDNLTGEGEGDDEQLIVKLDSIPVEYDTVVFYVSIYQGRSRGQEFSKVENAFIRAVDARNKEIARYTITGDKNAAGKRSLVFAQAKRVNNTWEFEAIGNTYTTDDLMDIANEYKKGTVNSGIDMSKNNNPEEPQRKKLFGLF